MAKEISNLPQLCNTRIRAKEATTLQTKHADWLAVVLQSSNTTPFWGSNKRSRFTNMCLLCMHSSHANTSYTYTFYGLKKLHKHWTWRDYIHSMISCITLGCSQIVIVTIHTDYLQNTKRDWFWSDVILFGLKGDISSKWPVISSCLYTVIYMYQCSDLPACTISLW